VGDHAGILGAVVFFFFWFCLEGAKKKGQVLSEVQRTQNAILWTPLVTPLAHLDTGLCKGWPFLIYGRWSQRGQWKMGCIQILGWREASVVSTGSPRRYGDKGFSIGPFDYHVQDATLIVLDIGRGPPPYGALSSSPSVGRGGPFEDPFIRRMRF
jgi:hypothetical protein